MVTSHGYYVLLYQCFLAIWSCRRPSVVVGLTLDLNQQHHRSSSSCGGVAGSPNLEHTTRKLESIVRDALRNVEFLRRHLKRTTNSYHTLIEEDDDIGLSITSRTSLEGLNRSLDWQARNLPSLPTGNFTTVAAGLGYTDDRIDRTMERYISGALKVGAGGGIASSLARIEPTASLLMPTLFEQGDETMYRAMWMGTHKRQGSSAAGDEEQSAVESWMYYPPLQETYGHPLNLGDVLGNKQGGGNQPFKRLGKQQQREANAAVPATISLPYVDAIDPTNPLITAHTTLEEEDETTIRIGVDLSVDRLVNILDESNDHPRGMAMVVDSQWNVVLMSPTSLHFLYPIGTATLEAISTPLSTLTNANWESFLLQDGASTTINITLTGDTAPTEFRVEKEPWKINNDGDHDDDDVSVVDWTTILLLPYEEEEAEEEIEQVEELETKNLVEISINGSSIQNPEEGGDDASSTSKRYHHLPEGINARDMDWHLELEKNSILTTTVVLQNRGKHAVSIQFDKRQLPIWLALDDDEKAYDGTEEERVLTQQVPPGSSWNLPIVVRADRIQQEWAHGLLLFTVQQVLREEDNNEHLPPLPPQILSTTILATLQEEPMIYELNNTAYGGIIGAAIIALACGGWSLWVACNSSHRVVRASQPIFLHMMCTGIAMMASAMIPLSFDTSLTQNQTLLDASCMATPWLLSMGFAITFGALYSKVWRIRKIVKNAKSFRRVHVSTRDVLIPFFVVAGLVVVVLTTWTILWPSPWTLNPVIEGGDTNSSFGQCQANPWSNLCKGLLTIIIVVALVGALVQLFRVRGLSTEYSEGKWIGITLGVWLIQFVVLLPVLVKTPDYNVKSSYIVQCIILFASAASLLMLTFLPKFFMANPISTAHDTTSLTTPTNRTPRHHHPEMAPAANSNNGGNGGRSSGGLISSVIPENNAIAFDNHQHPNKSPQGMSSPQQSDPKRQRANTVSSITVSMAPVSELEILGSVPQSEESDSMVNLPPKRPLRMPTELLEDDDPEEGECGGGFAAAQKSGDDAPAKQQLDSSSKHTNRSDQTNATKPERLVSVAEETTCGTESGLASFCDQTGWTKSTASGSVQSNAKKPERLPSSAEDISPAFLYLHQHTTNLPPGGGLRGCPTMPTRIPTEILGPDEDDEEGDHDVNVGHRGSGVNTRMNKDPEVGGVSQTLRQGGVGIITCSSSVESDRTNNAKRPERLPSLFEGYA